MNSVIVDTDPAPTLDDVWKLFRETNRQIQEFRQLMQEQKQESALEFKEIRQLMQEQKQAEDKRSQEADKRSQEADRRHQKAEREFEEIRQLFKQAEKRSKELEKSIGRLGNRLGEFVEGFVAPAAVRLFRDRKIEITGISRDIERNNPKLNLATQIDLLAVNGDTCVLIEVKSNLSIDDVNDHWERMAKFKPLFPEYVKYKVYGALAGMVIPQNVGRYAYRKGFFVIGQTANSVKILNDEEFKPVEW